MLLLLPTGCHVGAAMFVTSFKPETPLRIRQSCRRTWWNSVYSQVIQRSALGIPSGFGMLRNVFVPILGKIEKGLEFVANPQNRTRLLFGSHVKNDFVDPTNHQIVGFYGIGKAIILIYAFHSTVFYATSKSTSHFRRIIRHSSSHNSTASN